MLKDNSVRAVVITRYWPIPEVNGAFKYTSQLVRALVDSGAHVCVIGAKQFSDNQLVDMRNNLELNRPLARIYAWMFRGLPVAATLFANQHNDKKLRQVLARERPTHVFIDHIASSWAFTSTNNRKSAQSVDAIYVAHNVEHDVRRQAVSAFRGKPIRRIANALDAWRCRRTETTLGQESDAVICISDSDAEFFKSCGARKVVVFRPVFAGRDDFGPDTINRKRQVVVLGSFLWDIKRINLANFLENCQVALGLASVDVKVVGWIQEPFLSEFRARWPGVIFTGFVADPASELLDSRIGLVIDEAGGGFKLKMLDYVANGLPIIGLKNAIGSDLADLPESGITSSESYDKLVSDILVAIDDAPLLEMLRSRATVFFGKRHGFNQAKDALAKQILDQKKTIL